MGRKIDEQKHNAEGSEEGSDLWRAIMRSTRKIISKSITNHRTNHRKNHRQSYRESHKDDNIANEKKNSLANTARSYAGSLAKKNTTKVTTATSVSDLEQNKASGLDRRLAQKLRRGNVPIEITLDLHGMTRVAAAVALRTQIPNYHARGTRCLLIITGKGKGLLRNDLPMLLGEQALKHLVLGHCLAQARDGGAGARYVLLRRKRNYLC